MGWRRSQLRRARTQRDSEALRIARHDAGNVRSETYVQLRCLQRIRLGAIDGEAAIGEHTPTRLLGVDERARPAARAAPGARPPGSGRGCLRPFRRSVTTASLRRPRWVIAARYRPFQLREGELWG